MSFENLNVIEILKVGLPGLVFLLSLFSYRLLSAETKNEKTDKNVLSAIKQYMYLNIVFALMTVAAPIIDKTMFKEHSSPFEFVKFQVQGESSSLQMGKASVCTHSKYQNRYILLGYQHNNQMKTVEVFATPNLPCDTDDKLVLSSGDVSALGIDSQILSTLTLSGSAASQGLKFETVPG